MRLPLPRHVLAVPLAVVALAGCGSSGGGASGRSPGPADVMPKSSVFYLEAAVRPDGDQATAVIKLLSRVMRTGDPGAKLRRLIDEHLAAEQPGVTYEHDIAPWLGDRVGMTATNLATGEPGLVAAVTVRDVARAKAFVAAQEARERAHKRAYHGTAYYAEDDGSVTGVVEDFVVIADTEAGFKRAVDTAGGDGLSDVARFDDAVDELPSDRVGMLYVDPQRLADAAGAAAGDPTAAGVLSTAVDGLGVITAFARAGEDTATLESRVTVQEGSTGAALASLAAGGAPDLVKSLPADSWAAFGMAKLGETLTGGLDSLAGGLGGAVLGGQLQQRLGIDIQQDLLSWMGDVAVFVRGDTPAQVRGGLVVQATDEAKAAAALPRLVAAARSRGGVDFQDVHMGNIDQAWAATVPGMPEPLVLARAGDRVVLALGPGAAAAAADPSGATLGDSGVYGRAKNALDGLDPILLVDGPTVVGLLGRAAGGDPGFAEVRPYLDLLDLVAGGTTKDGDTLRQRVTAKLR